MSSLISCRVNFVCGMNHFLCYKEIEGSPVLRHLYSFHCHEIQRSSRWCSESESPIYEPPHDKTNKMSVRPTKTQISLGSRPVWSEPGHPPSPIRVFAVHMKKAWVLSYLLSAQRRLWSDWANAQVDLSLRWAHSHFVRFVMSRLILLLQLFLFFLDSLWTEHFM